MKYIRAAAVLACLCMTGCGGGGGSSSTPPPSPPSVSLSATYSSAVVPEDNTVTTATATATVTGSAGNSIVPDLSFDHNIFSSVVATPGTVAGTYTVTATTLPNLPGDTYVSPIAFRLCQESPCVHAYAGTSVTYTYTLTVKLKDWGTYQRTASHTGYVHATLDPARFAKAWTWVPPTATYISAAVSGGDNVYFSILSGTVYALNEGTGAQVWSSNLTTPTGLHAPGALAYDNGTLYVPAFVTIPGSTFYGTAAIRALDATNGTFKSDSAFISQIRDFNSPTIVGTNMYYSQGYFGGQIWKYSLPDGATVWNNGGRTNQFGNESVAADANYVYYSNGWRLDIYNTSDGSLYANIGGPQLVSTGLDTMLAPMIMPDGKVIYFDDSGARLVSVDVPTKSIAWQSASNYQPQPVSSGSTIYAAHNYPFRVDAINEADGSIRWSWDMPSGDNNFIENMIVCDNLLFVSTDKNIYAINLTTHQTAWTFVGHGRLSLSSHYMLYVASTDLNTFGTLVSSITAIKLR